MRISIWVVALIAALPGLCLLNQAAGAADATNPAAPLRVVFTADTEGHLDACQSCPGPVGLGGLARRAAAIRQLRAAGPLLLLDGGNSAFGDETVASQGGAVIAAYDAIGYDAINVCYRDFPNGKAQAVKLFGGGHTPAVSANLLDPGTGEPFFKPYVVRPFGGRRVAVIGLTESPAGLAVLPRLTRQLDGVRIDPPDAALAKWLPRAKAEADQVVLLFYGSPPALNAISPALRAQCAMIFLGGVRPEELPVGSRNVYAAEQHGRSLALVATGAAPESRQVTMDAAVPRDGEMDALLSKYQAPPVDLPVVAVATPPQGAEQSPTTLPAVAIATPPGTEQPPMPRQETQTSAPSTAPSVTPAVVASPPAADAAAVKRVAAHQNLTPKGLEGVGLTAEQVNTAIDRGAAFLWNYIKSEDLQKHHQKLGDAQEHLLAMLALVHTGAVQKFPDFEPALRAYLAQSKNYYSMGTYEEGLLCMLIESYGDPVFFRQQRDAAQYLVDSQGPLGTWTYFAAVPPAKDSGAVSGGPLSVLSSGMAPGASRPRIARLNDWKIGKDGDNSCSQFAILGLHSASRSNNPIADEVWSRNLDANTRRQYAPDGSWPYNETASPGYGSMTCAGLCAVAIDRYELHQTPPEVDARIERGLAWLDQNFSVTANPDSGNYLFYYLYSLERVGRVLDTEFIGSHEWYPQGARFLVDKQAPDGKWLDPTASVDDPRVPTSFALLFLTRATPKLQVIEKHGGPGILRAQVQSPPPSRIYIILDASGSMIDMMQGQLKFDIARNAVKSLIDALPDSTQVAMRVYGNYKTALDPDCDSDTTLEIRMGPLDRKAFAAKLKSLRARGKTPLALSLTDAINEFSTSQSDPGTLLLLTDGGEDTWPRRNPVKVADELAKRAGLTFHIVGFDINQADWGEQLRAMAEHGHGYYWPAAGAQDLPAQVSSAIFGRPAGFSVTDAQGMLITQGHFGQPMPLPEGSYHLRTAYAGRDFETPFAINTDNTTAILFDATQITAAQIAAMAPPTPTAPEAKPVSPTDSAAPTPKFCTHCGNPLPPGAKFCPHCGQPVGR